MREQGRGGEGRERGRKKGRKEESQYLNVIEKKS